VLLIGLVVFWSIIFVVLSGLNRQPDHDPDGRVAP
jgi:hypothetical protein